MVKNTVKISVIIPVYNCEKYLKLAVESVLEQKLEKIEIILINDGSNDRSPQICDELAEVHESIKVIHQKNKGVSCARNCGIEYVLENTKVEEDGYIAFLDSDDLWRKEFFDQEVLSDLSQDIDILGYQSCLCTEDMTWCSTPNKVLVGLYTDGIKVKKSHFGQHFGSAFYSCSLLRQCDIRFDTGLKYGEDDIFKTKCYMLANQTLIKEKVLYLYRDNPMSVMHKMLPQ